MKALRRSGAFTLIEVLVVVAIIALLVAILLPSLARAREQARMAMCKSNSRQLMTGVSLYMADYKVTPATLSTWDQGGPGIPGRDANLKHTNWVWDGADDAGANGAWGNYPDRNNANFILDVPKRGTIFRYVRDEKLYVCPSDYKGNASDTAMGGGGNGRSSYSMNAYIGYKSIEDMVRPANATGWKLPAMPSDPSPLIVKTRATFSPSQMLVLVEEHPWGNNYESIEGNFNVVDEIVARHSASATSGKGRSNISYLDTHIDSPFYKIRTNAYELFRVIGFPAHDSAFRNVFCRKWP